jgi:hypothetical protein
LLPQTISILVVSTTLKQIELVRTTGGSTYMTVEERIKPAAV